MSQVQKGEPEPEYCIQYHKYVNSLSKMMNDRTLKGRHHIIAQILRDSIGHHYLKLCVPEARTRNPLFGSTYK